MKHQLAITTRPTPTYKRLGVKGMSKKCVECNETLSGYKRVPLCDKCFQEMLTYKLTQEDGNNA